MAFTPIDLMKAPQHETTALLASQVVDAERAAGMTQPDLDRALASYTADVQRRLASCPDQLTRDRALDSCIRAALHTRLRDALDYRAEREADARLRVKLGMPAK